MNKKIVFSSLIVVLLLSAFMAVTEVGANSSASEGVARLNPNTAYTLQDLENLPHLLDVNCDKAGYELCQTLGHYGVLYMDAYGIPRIPGMFHAPDGFWYVTDADSVFAKAGSACYPYIEVAWHQSGACLDTANPLCRDYVAHAGFVYNWHPEGKWPAGMIPKVSGYYPAGDASSPLYCKIQQ
jgi:hypothetical protein